MLHRLSEYIADYFFDENDKYPKEVYKYGIELTISSILGTLMIIITGIISVCSMIKQYKTVYHPNLTTG